MSRNYSVHHIMKMGPTHPLRPIYKSSFIHHRRLLCVNMYRCMSHAEIPSDLHILSHRNECHITGILIRHPTESHYTETDLTSPSANYRISNAKEVAQTTSLHAKSQWCKFTQHHSHTKCRLHNLDKMDNYDV